MPTLLALLAVRIPGARARSLPHRAAAVPALERGGSAAAGLTPAQHQLLLAVRGHPDPAGPTIGELSEYLVLRHHSVVELVDRAVAGGLARRRRDDADSRVVRLRLTADGERAIEELARLHLEEIRRLAPVLRELGDGER